MSILNFIYNWKSRDKHFCALANASKTLSAIYTGAEHSLQLLKVKMKDDEQKKFTPPLVIDSELFHRAFANPHTM
jgi:hypothetical protein